MDVIKMTVKVPRNLLERAKQYAQENDTTLTRLVILYFDQLEIRDDPLAEAPIVRRLSGSLSQDMTAEAYHQHLDEKYGPANQVSDRF